LPSEINIALSILGIIAIGSIFAIISNSTIDRVPKNQSMIDPSPYCKVCAAKLFWKDMIPIWSYIKSKGRCPYCSSAIPKRKLIVEITEISWVAIFIQHQGWSYEAFLKLTIGMVLIAIIAIGQEDRKLSDIILLLLGMLSAIYILAFEPGTFPVRSISFLIGGGILVLYNSSKIFTSGFIKSDFTEIKFGAILGLFLGFPQIILCVFLAFVFGAVLGSFKIKFRAEKNTAVIPQFIVLMSYSGLTTILFGSEFISFYNLALF